MQWYHVISRVRYRSPDNCGVCSCCNDAPGDVVSAAGGVFAGGVFAGAGAGVGAGGSGTCSCAGKSMTCSPADVSVNSCFATELELQQSHKDLFWSWTPRKLKGSIHMHLTYLARKPSTGPATSKRAVDAVEDLPWAVWRKLRLTIRGSQEQRRSRCLTIRRNGHNENWFQAFVWDWPLLFYEPCFHDSRKPENPLENSTSESHQGDQSCFEKFYTS